MSLINKVLKDLESRAGDLRAGVRDRQMYADLRSARAAPPGRRTRLFLLVLLLAVVALGALVVTHGGPEEALQAVTMLVREPPPTPAVPARVAQPEPQSAASAPEPPPEPAVVAGRVTDTLPAPTTAAGAPAAAPPDPSSGPGVAPRPAPVRSADDPAEGAYREAVRLLRQRQSDAAESPLRRALRHNPDHVAARELLVGVLLERNRWSEAQQLLEQGLVELPYHRGFTFLLARIYVEQGAEPRALSLLQAGRADAGKDPEYIGFLATLYQRAGRHAEASEAYRQAVTLRPQDSKLWLGFAGSLEAQRNWSAAAEAYQRALATGGLSGELSRYASQRLTGVRGRL